MSTVRILLEVHSTDERTPQELADIAAGRLTSCLGVDQRVSDPVRVVSIDTDPHKDRFIIPPEAMGFFFCPSGVDWAQQEVLAGLSQPSKRTWWRKLWGWL